MIGDLIHMLHAHDLRLVLVAMLICAIACFASLTLVSRGIGNNARWLWLAASALAFGSGTWAAHFISMLAFAPNVPMGYDMAKTALSIVVGVAGSAAGLAVFQKVQRNGLDIPI